ncbi:MAG TPA: sulfurtransferase [Chloroflexota bacterium]|jgi:thiosulfate/3-mercaptopyruvate sulfurtransferase
MITVDPKGGTKVAEYAHPEMLVTTQWVVDHQGDSSIRIAESDEDILLYEVGHVPGAVKIDWHTDLQHPLRRDFVDKDGFEKLCSERGISNDTTVVFYGDRNNWFALYSLWLFRYYGHSESKLKVMNGGRQKWEEEKRAYTKDVPSYPAATYKAKDPDSSVRAYRDEVLASINKKNIIDVRSPAEYSGEALHMANYPQEGAMRGGHVPSAKSIPWALAANADGTFKSADELATLYEGKGIKANEPTIAYCRIGERSSHTWFVLHYLLGYKDVKNYDGSWTEWGSLVNVPIER